MTRRALLAIIAVARPFVVLEAIAGPRLPERRVMAGLPQARYFERRVYRGAGDLRPIFERCGVRLCAPNLFAFDSLAQRAEAWTRVAADPEWARLRHRATVTEVTIYRLQS